LGFGQIYRRRRDRWQRAGVFDQLHRVLPADLNAAGRSTGPGRVRMGLTSARKKEGADTGPSPVDRRKSGSKHHLMVSHGVGEARNTMGLRALRSDGLAVPASGVEQRGLGGGSIRWCSWSEPLAGNTSQLTGSRRWGHERLIG
jgi:hypothetical protein